MAKGVCIPGNLPLVLWCETFRAGTSAASSCFLWCHKRLQGTPRRRQRTLVPLCSSGVPAAGHCCGQHTLGKAGCDPLWKQKEEFGKHEALQTSSFNFCREEMGKKPRSCSVPAFYRIFNSGTAPAWLLIALGDRSPGRCQSCGPTPLYPQLRALEGSPWDRLK